MSPYNELRKRLTDSGFPWTLVKPGTHEQWELPGGFLMILSRGISFNGHARQNYLKQIERAERAYMESLPVQMAVNAPAPVPLPSPFQNFEPRPLPLIVEETKPAPMPVVTPEPGSGLQTLNFGNAPIRLVVRDGEPWWMASDVCSVLDLTNVGNALARLDPEEKDDIRSVDVIGRPCQINIINESGLYSLVLGSRKPEAKAFKKWITSEVIPSIRKKGSYSVKEPFQNMSRLEWIEFALLAEKEKEERGKVITKQQQTIGCQVEEIQVLTELAEETSGQLERIATAPMGSLSLREAAKHLQVSPTWFSQWLREIGWLYPGPFQPIARQEIINAGWLKPIVREYEHGPSYEMVTVTPAGLVKLAYILGKEK